MRRLPKDSVRRFLIAQYSNYGAKYIEYLFGAKVSRLFQSSKNTIDVIDAISTALIGMNSYILWWIEI